MSCATTAPATPLTTPVKELWVDSAAPVGGDGSRQRPLRTLPQPVEPNTALHVRTGVYTGPFVFTGTSVTGHGVVVLTAAAGQTTVTARDTRLTNLSVQGGDIGLEAGAGVTGGQLAFTGQRHRAAQVTGALSLNDATLVATIEGSEGLGVLSGARLELRSAQFTGGFRRAVACLQGAVQLEGLSVTGSKTPLHLVDCESKVANVTARAGSGPGLFAARGTLEVQGLTVEGQEYGLQLGKGVRATARQLNVSGTAQACVSAQHAELHLEGAALQRCGMSGGVTLFDSVSRLQRVEVGPTPELGVLVRHGDAHLSGVRVRDIASSGEAMGDGVHVREATVHVHRLHTSDTRGSGLFVSSAARVDGEWLDVERARQAAMFVERGSEVRFGAVLVRGGASAVVVPDQALVRLDALSVAGGDEVPIYAECDRGAEVQIGRLESSVEQVTSRCITRLTVAP